MLWRQHAHPLNAEVTGTLEMPAIGCTGEEVGEWKGMSPPSLVHTRLVKEWQYSNGLTGEEDGKGCVWRNWRDLHLVLAKEKCRNSGKNKHHPPFSPGAICVFTQRSIGSCWWVWVCAQLVQTQGSCCVSMLDVNQTKIVSSSSSLTIYLVRVLQVIPAAGKCKLFSLVILQK